MGDNTLGCGVSFLCGVGRTTQQEVCLLVGNVLTEALDVVAFFKASAPPIFNDYRTKAEKANDHIAALWTITQILNAVIQGAR